MIKLSKILSNSMKLIRNPSSKNQAFLKATTIKFLQKIKNKVLQAKTLVKINYKNIFFLIKLN
jgi:hypothetical protein